MSNLRSLAAIALAGALLAPADTLTFRNGNRVDGTLVGIDNGRLRFSVGNHTNTYDRSEVDSIQFSGGDASSYNNGGPDTSNRQNMARPNSNGYDSAQNGNYTNASAGDVEVPAGTEVAVRMIDGADSQNDRVGQTYRCSIDQPIAVNGRTVIPRGADAMATLVDAKQSGKIEGRTSLMLDLKSVRVNGQDYDLVTNRSVSESSSRGARSAKVIGGTAAVGAIIGAIAGGGKGAAIGAGSGAAVGTGAQVLTSGQRVRVPSETRLSFSLQNPLMIHP